MLTTAIRLEVQRQRVRAKLDNIILLEQRCDAGRRPYIHPIRPLDGCGVLTEDSPDHHPWQHGLYTGLHGVNGSDFWFDQGEQVGRIETQAPQLMNDDTWCVETLWRHHQGHGLLNEQQQWQLRIVDGLLVLDLQWELTALIDVHIDQCAYGGLFLRMPFTTDKTVSVLNSRGQSDGDCEQSQAEWVALHMDIDGRDDVAGMAIFDHPSNSTEASQWRVDGQRGINPGPCISGPISIAQGQCHVHRYQVLVFSGSIPEQRLHQSYQLFAED